MYDLLWTVLYEEDGADCEISGSYELQQGENHILCALPACTIKRVIAEIHLETDRNEAIFMNGYQTWTYSPEYDLNGFTEGVKKKQNEIKNNNSLKSEEFCSDKKTI